MTSYPSSRKVVPPEWKTMLSALRSAAEPLVLKEMTRAAERAASSPVSYTHLTLPTKA